jgi:hypothetical protein
MAASMKCGECRKVKRCHLYKVRTTPEGETPGPHAGTWLGGDLEYLCRPCARELGYLVLDTASTPE